MKLKFQCQEWNKESEEQCRECGLFASSAAAEEDDSELDGQLRDELLVLEQSRENTPVPLLTPPHSPLMVEIGGSRTTVCEWPSNLAVDSAMTNIKELRPLNLSSMESLGQKQSSTLTPMMRGMYVDIYDH